MKVFTEVDATTGAVRRVLYVPRRPQEKPDTIFVSGEYLDNLWRMDLGTRSMVQIERD